MTLLIIKSYAIICWDTLVALIAFLGGIYGKNPVAHGCTSGCFLSFRFLVAPVHGANADQPSFSIAPPPIANPVFDEDEAHMKVRATYLTMEGTDTANPFEINGYGIDYLARKAFNSVIAIDGGIGVTALDGDMGTGSFAMSLNGVTVPLTFNLEIQPIKTSFFNLIVFGGPQFSFSYMYADFDGGYMDIDSYVYGFQAGAQMGFNIADTIGIDVFGMTLSQSGSQDVYYSTVYTTDSQSSDIPSYTTTSFGLDFEFIPWGLTLSSILQEAGKSDSNGTKTHLYQLSWSHKF